ncbi:glycine dehydrogenase (aminomethyl-transferring) [Elstera cyanobacteriorum]|uniref:glycine dehydrogenase (aminomethyl-transferring) n=1 Tax=Elstera cyanobacteriorum TaxID=2022747 RepID=A0A255XNW4_9PROT|nr:aminomethyl-transferring glycine dehydrogenase subunit GcvPB [Elstera cyanobacteriorum]OYQ18125.1 glycine dehydrogenase (aminomethyl-transferring) [Elstera cyanobacteriorum]GFZ83589.1 glycine dehydrogenase (aminomethyl-transferring) [Elstera cyanobacteriorum]
MTLLDRSQGRSARETAAETASVETFSGNRGLVLEEGLIFELGQPGRLGVDLPDAPQAPNRLGGLARRGGIGLPDLAEPQVVRHFTRLSQKNYGIDSGFFPLGSCTMKHNPRLNERMARLPGFSDVHPLQPISTVQGALELIDTLAHWLKTLTGMPAVAMSPAAGAHGEFCGMVAIKAALAARGESHRTRVLVPESAHGTNPATAAAIGFTVDPIPATTEGRVDLDAFKAKLGPDVAAIMLTNPNTCGLFERDIREIADAIHGAGGYFYCDGANFNAIVGRVRPADLGVDCMHINLHKTFSTPHGGGGPGSGPVVLSDALAPFAPLPWVVNQNGSYAVLEQAKAEAAQSFGRLKAFHGQMGMFVRALAYMLSHGADGLWQVSSDAVLNANYILASLKDVFSAPFEGPCMHEVLFNDDFLKDTGVSTLDFAKALIDEGYHPMTMYFPLVVHGAMLIEPTETEDKATLDQFIAVMRSLADKAKAGTAEAFHAAPRLTPRRRLDETLAARKPILRWVAPELAQAAE